MSLRITARRPHAAGPVGGRRRRHLLTGAALGVVIVLLSAGTGAGATQARSPAAVQEEPPPGIVPPGEWSEVESSFLVKMVRDAEATLPKFNDIPAIEAQGFVNIGVLSAGYAHYVNVRWMTDGHILNPNYPESLVYGRNASGAWEVVAAMYFLTPDITVDTVPDLISWMPGWHAHPELCSDELGRVVGIPINGQCTRGQPVTTPMMHVWIVDNQCGHRFGGLGVGGLHCDYEHEH
jgi:hypothetical protein